MKRLFSLFLTLLLIVSFAALAPEAYAAEAENVIFVELYDQVFEFGYSKDIKSWNDLIALPEFEHPELGVCDWVLVDDIYVALKTSYNSDSSKSYVLVDDDLVDVGMFVTISDDMLSDGAYLTTVGIEIFFADRDGVYLFEYPSYVRTWKDLVAEGFYYYSDLGICQWVLDDGLIKLDIGIGAASKRYYHDSISSNVDSADADVFQFGVARAGRWYFVPEHTHDLKVFRELKPDCVNNGYRDYQCTICPYGEYVELDPLGHSYFLLTTLTEPTCTKPGEGVYRCSNCGVVTNQAIAALGHDYPIIGVCRREGCDSYPGKDFVDNVFGGNSPSGENPEGSSGSDNFFDKLLDGAGNLVDGGVDWVKDRFNNAFHSDGPNWWLISFGAVGGLAFIVILITLFSKVNKNWRKNK